MPSIITLPPAGAMSPGARKLRDFYAMKKDAPVYQREFGFYVMDKWKAQGYVKKDVTDAELAELFGYDPGGAFPLYNLGWCEAGFDPVFEVKVLEDLGDYELVQDFAGRSVKYFKGRRDGFMPEYIACPVTDQKSWEEKCLWRMDPKSQGRRKGIEWAIRDGIPAAREGKIISANLVGGYMYLRSLIGPLELLYMFYENPDLIHRCMEAWLNLADSVYAEIQKEISFDEVFLAEDICYKKGLLISPEMVREFLFPYYQQLITNIKARQLDKSRKLYFTIDTDGNCDQFIPLYSELGLDYLSPFEVAAGNDVVRTGKEYPNLLMHGGIDKRILAESKEAIDREVDRIMPVMKKRGGYIPTCDHGVPEEVPFENYLHYRKRMKEFA